METFNLRHPLRARIARRIAKWAKRKMTSRPADFVIGSPDNPYLMRWWILPRNNFFNVYLHLFMRSDDDRALHDHPWWNASFVLDGGYKEHMPLYPDEWPERGEIKVERRGPGDIVFRKAEAAHRVELWNLHLHNSRPIFCTSLFFTGPRIREWGFHCPKGWVRWHDFVSVRPGGNEVGKGCDQ